MSPARATPAAAGAGIRAAWLAEDVLMVVGAAIAQGPEPRAAVGRHRVGLEARVFAPSHNGSAPELAILRLASGDRPAGTKLKLTIGDQGLSLERPDLGQPANDLTALVRTDLADLDPEVRAGLMDFLATECAEELSAPGGALVANRLNLARDMLRERLPLATMEADKAQGMHVDELHTVDSNSFWFKGWIWDADGTPQSLTMVSPEGQRTELLERSLRYRRADIDRMYSGSDSTMDTGVVCFFELGTSSRLTKGWIAELRSATGAGIEAEPTGQARAPLAVRDTIIAEIGHIPKGGNRRRLVAEHAYPAISRVHARLARRCRVERSWSFGDPPAAPGVSVVVPLLERLDALELHLAHFHADPVLAGTDLLYVLDLPAATDELAAKASELHELYGVPFRLLTLTERAGVTIMSAVGAAAARAGRLLFLSPDVMPAAPGWLAAMAAFCDSRPGVGAVGPQLLFEDGSIQHAGLCFRGVSPQDSGILDQPDAGVWETQSRFRGLPAATPGAAEAAPVPAVSGACLMVDRAVFEEVGGLRNAFVEGECEDADLCLRLAEAGRENWYLPEAVLYNLAGRSRTEPAAEVGQYNRLLLSHLWADRLEADEPASG